MTTADEIVERYSDQLSELCRRTGVRRLEIFGSAAAGNFDPNHSDLDFLYEFDDVTAPDLADRYFALSDGLQELFGRKIDLVDATSIRNPYFLKKINTQRRVLYAA
ncbi:MAG: nucleotidyltransferase family protein [Tepidisphaeraceae bacterium]